MTYTPPQEPVFRLDSMASPRPKRRPGLVFGIAAGVLVVLLAGAGIGYAVANGSSAPQAAASPAATTAAPETTLTQTAAWKPPPPTDVSAAFGQTMELTSSAGDEFHYVVEAAQAPAKTKYGTKPEKGAFYAIKVTVNVIAGSTYVCPCDFALIAASGEAYEGTSVGITGGLDALTVNRGQKATGLVAFDIPAGADRGGKIELREGSTNQAFWLIP